MKKFSRKMKAIKTIEHILFAYYLSFKRKESVKLDVRRSPSHRVPNPYVHSEETIIRQQMATRCPWPAVSQRVLLQLSWFSVLPGIFSTFPPSLNIPLIYPSSLFCFYFSFILSSFLLKLEVKQENKQIAKTKAKVQSFGSVTSKIFANMKVFYIRLSPLNYSVYPVGHLL